MNRVEAVRVVAECKRLWPAMQLPDQTVSVWALELTDEEGEDANKAVRDLARFQSRPPALAEILDACREAKRERVQTTMLPAGRPTVDGTISFKDWLTTQPEEVHERVRRVFPKWVRKSLG